MESWGKRRRILMVPLCAAAIGVGLCASALGADPVSSAADVKSAFDAAMAQPPAQRAAALEKLETDAERFLSEGPADTAGRCLVLEIKYRSQIALAKYTDAHESFGRYAQELTGDGRRQAARVVLLEFIRSRRLNGHLGECVAIAEASLEHWGSDGELAPGLLYQKAEALARLNGRAKEAVPVCSKIIQDFPASPWRPKAMRLLGNLQANGSGGNHHQALATLALMEQQYAGSWYEQYAHMKPAMIYEARMGNPQAALERFQETLKKFPNHKYATFCRREIERLKKVLEAQLIQDALEDIARAGAAGCDRPNTMIVRAGPVAQEHVSLAEPRR